MWRNWPRAWKSDEPVSMPQSVARYQTRPMLLTSQLPVSRWHEQIRDPTVAGGILDRLVHNVHRIEMRGDSMRKSVAGRRRAAARRISAVLSGERGCRPFPRTPFSASGRRLRFASDGFA